MMRTLLALPALALLAACETTMPPPTDPAPVQDGTCDEASLQAFVGGPSSALFATTFTIPVRFIRPGEAVTMDFQPNRANFEIDAAEVVTRAYCG